MTIDIEKLTLNYLDIIDEQIIFLDADCKILFFNKAAKKRFKGNAKSFLGKDCEKLCKFRGYTDLGKCPAIIARKTGKKQIEKIEDDEGNTYQVIVYPIIEKDKINGYLEISSDITERKITEERIQQSEEKYRGLIETSPYGIWISDLEGNIEMINQRGCELYGYNSTDELIGMNSMDLVVLEDKGIVVERLQDYLQTGEIKAIELKLIKKDGSIFYGETISKALLDNNGKPTAFIGIVNDITERREAIKLIRESEEKFRSLVETTNDWIWEVDIDSTYTYSNSKVKDILGYEPDEIIGKKSSEFLIPEEVQMYREMADEIKRSKQSFSNLEYISVHKNGQHIILESFGAPILDSNGNLIGLRGIDRDITERKKIEDQIQESEEKFRSIVETTSDWIWEVNKKGIYVYSNPKIKEILGYEPEEILGKMVTKFRTFEEQEKMVDVFMGYVARKEPFNQIESTYTHRNGQKRIMETSGVPILDINDELKGYRCIDRDITKRKESEVELKRSEEKYRQLFNNANDAIFLIEFTDKQKPGNFLDVNNIACQRYGYTREEFLQLSPLDITSSEDQNQIPEIMKQLEVNDQITFDLMQETKDGRRIPVEISSHVFELENKKVVLSVVRDITERKDAEIALLESERKYSTLLYEMINGFTYRQLIYDDTGKAIDLLYEEVNDNYEMHTGKKKDEVIGKKFSEIYPEAFKDTDFEWLKAYAEVAMTGEPKRFVQYFKDLEGWFDISVFSIRKGYVATAFENITDRIEALKQIQESEERYRTLVETMNEGLAVIDTSNQFTFVNLKMHEILGYTLEELIGKSITDFLSKESQEIIEEQIRERQKGISKPYELSFIRKDGTFVDTMISPKPLYDELSNYLGSFAVITDITDQKKAEEIRKMAYNQIVNNIQEFANLIDGIRNPLSVIQSTIDLEIPNWKQMIDTQIRKIASITDQIDLRWSESEQFRNTLIERLR